MIKRISERLQREDKGFTLIELMVVVLIIAILIAIAIPTFLGARRRAQDRAAQSSLRNTVTAAKTVFTDNESYCDASTCATPSVPATKLTNGEPSLQFKDSATSSTQAVEVSVDSTDANTFYGAAYSKSGKCWFVRDVAGPGSTTIGGTFWAVDNSGTTANCTGANAAAASGYTRDLGSL